MAAYSRKIEALAESIIHYSGYLNPGSSLHESRNPGGLPATSIRHIKDKDGKRVFTSILDGMQALLYDVQLKLSGQSWARLKPHHDLTDLAASYGQPNTAASAWARFLRQALKDETITKETPLSYFLEANND